MRVLIFGFGGKVLSQTPNPNLPVFKLNVTGIDKSAKCASQKILFKLDGNRKDMPKRNRAVSFLVMPIALLLWCIGWSLYWVGLKRESTIPKPKLSVQKELVIFVPTPEQKYAT
jgi:hypothetical protein